MRPSYAQMAQKPKIASAPKSPTEVMIVKEVRKGSFKQEEPQKAGKNNNQKSNDDRENQRKDTDADKSGLMAKTQKHPRDSRIASDSGPRGNQKPSTASNRSNSYSGQAIGKESYASKSSANVQNASAKAGNTTQIQNKNPKANNGKVANNTPKPQKQTEADSSTEETQNNGDDQVPVNLEQNNNKEGQEGDSVEEN